MLYTVWYEGLLLCKLNSIGISDKFYELIENYLSNKIQMVVLNGQTNIMVVNSCWHTSKVLFLLGPLLFLVYVNDMPKELKSNIKLLADDVS